jgi:putative PIN family toxin of toxin-antitoxin system
VIVCDTNVLVSAFAFPGGLPERIFRGVLTGRFQHATSPDILTELSRVLRCKLALAPERAAAVHDLLVRRSKLVYPSRRLRIVREDDADNRILECADEAKADFVVTGDRHHLLPLGRHGRTVIISPRDFADAVGLV